MVKVVSDIEPPVKLAAWRDEVSALVSGAIVGAATWILTYALSEYVIGMIACRTESSIITCGDVAPVSSALALIIASVVGLTILVRRRIFRPLLVVLAAAISLWGINGSWLAQRSFLDFFLSVALTALIYLVFAWFAKVRQFWVALAVSIVLMIVFRLMIVL